MFSTCLSTWTLSELTGHRNVVHDLHHAWKQQLDAELLSAKREKQKMAKAEIYSHPVNSKERQVHIPLS
jgi:hypothetical protein